LQLISFEICKQTVAAVQKGHSIQLLHTLKPKYNPVQASIENQVHKLNLSEDFAIATLLGLLDTDFFSEKTGLLLMEFEFFWRVVKYFHNSQTKGW